jgi:hypothetical protein
MGIAWNMVIVVPDIEFFFDFGALFSRASMHPKEDRCTEASRRRCLGWFRIALVEV